MTDWDQGEWGWSIKPADPKDVEREDPVQDGRMVTRWNIPVVRFMWQAFPTTLAHHDVFLSLN